MQKKETKEKYRVNDDIKNVTFIKLIIENQPPKEVHILEARKIAINANLDLVELKNDGYNVPIIKLMNYEKFLYNQKKTDKKNKQNSSKMKEIQLSGTISDNDLKTKFNKAKEFIEDGDRVKVTLMLKGRQKNSSEYFQEGFYKFIEMMSEISIPESTPKQENNRFTIFFKPKKK